MSDERDNALLKALEQIAFEIRHVKSSIFQLRIQISFLRKDLRRFDEELSEIKKRIEAA